MAGVFLTLEGGEGTGKTTQAARLAERLRADGLEVVLTREPGGAPGAEAIREVLVGAGEHALSPMAETLLFLAARRDHWDKTIAPALARRAWVVCDRYADSTHVYQSAAVAGGEGVDAATLDALHEAAGLTRDPDRTLVFDLDVDVAAKRRSERGGVVDRFEARDRAFHQAVREGFQARASAAPERMRLVDADGTADEVAGRVWEALGDLLPAPAQRARA